MMSTADNDNNVLPLGGGGEITSIKKERTSCEQNTIDNITEDINSLAVLDDKSVCANCGKEGNSNNMNICNKCKMVKYCNAACKKKHRTKHKKKCEKRVAELHEEALFKEPPPREECPICMLILPLMNQSSFYSCCGKIICDGCIFAMVVASGGGRRTGSDICPFCRTPPCSDEEGIKRTKKLMDKGNGDAYNMLAGRYQNGTNGYPQDKTKANELYLKAGELGCAQGYFNLSNSYLEARGVEKDLDRAIHYWELAAMLGHAVSRFNLGVAEHKAGDHNRATKHWLVAAKAGHDDSLDLVKQMFMQGVITKDEYANTLRTYKQRQDEMKSDERDEAAKLVGGMRLL